MINIAVDAMGGDNAPDQIVKGAFMALEDKSDIRILFTGQEERIRPILDSKGLSRDRIEIVNASEVITNEESPVTAIRNKKDSSIVRGMNLVKNGEADAFISAGSTGAVLSGGILIVGRLKGVERSPLAPIIPTEKGPALLLDCGANVDAKPHYLLQFAQMGSVYMERIVGVKSPKVGILNIGAEEEKGNQLVKEAFPLLKGCPGINFIGSVEARDIPEGYADVIVCDAFAGNVALKMYEGVGRTLLREIKSALMSSFKSKLGALLIKEGLKKTLKKFDMEEYGGAPLLGLKGLVVKAHGSSKAGEIRNAILQCRDFKQSGVNEALEGLFTKKTLE